MRGVVVVRGESSQRGSRQMAPCVLPVVGHPTPPPIRCPLAAARKRTTPSARDVIHQLPRDPELQRQSHAAGEPCCMSRTRRAVGEL